EDEARRRVDEAVRDRPRRVLDDEDRARRLEQVEVLDAWVPEPAGAGVLLDGQTDAAGEGLGETQVERTDDLGEVDRRVRLDADDARDEVAGVDLEVVARRVGRACRRADAAAVRVEPDVV